MFKPDNLYSPEQIFSELSTIQKYLENDCIPEGIALIERGVVVGNYKALTGKLLADSKYHLDTLKNSEIFKALGNSMENRLSPSLLNKFIDTACKDYQYLVNWSDRLNSACSHECDMIRTLISREKEMMKERI